MAGLQERYDTALLGILQNEEQIAPFLEVIFGFLYRRTDFYIVMKSQEDKLGFPPGIALKLAVGAFKKYEAMAQQTEKRKEKFRQQQKEKKEKKEKQEAEAAAAKAASKDGTNETESNEVTAASKSTSEPQASGEQQAEAVVDQKHQVEDHTAGVNKEDIQVEEKESAEIKDTQMETESGDGDKRETEQMDTGAASPSESSEKEEKSANADGEEDDNPELTKLQKIYQANPESHNGAIRDNYCWSQSIKDTDIRVKVPKYVSRGSQVKVDIQRKHLYVGHQDKKGQWCAVVDEELCWDINKEESLWSLVPGEHVHVNLEKVQERWWEAVLVSEPKISVRKIDPCRPMSDLDDEAQAKIEEMMYNEQQKRLGKPQSHEKKIHEMLQKAWDLDGSPFKGQPFDPSKLNISPDSTM